MRYIVTDDSAAIGYAGKDVVVQEQDGVRFIDVPDDDSALLAPHVNAGALKAIRNESEPAAQKKTKKDK